MLSGPVYLPKSVKKALVLLHGYGANGSDLFSLTNEISPFFPNMAVFAPNAPTLIFENRYEWFSLDDFFTDSPITTEYLTQICKRALPAIKKVKTYIQMIEQKYTLQNSQITIAGFSQGGLIAALTALTADKSFKELILMSAVPFVLKNIANVSKIPVLITHGAQDPIVPVRASTLSKQQLTQAGLSITEYISPFLGHGIDANCIHSIIQFMQNNP